MPLKNYHYIIILGIIMGVLVAIKRGEKEIIPKGDTQIYVGDYLITLANEDNASEIREKLTEIAEIICEDVYE